MRILVTGGAGFIGSQYVRSALAGELDEFCDSGIERLTVLDRLTYAGNLANLASVEDDPRYGFVRGDICDAHLLDAVLPGHDLVLNFAAETHVDRSIVGAADFVVTNVLGAQTLFEASLRAGVGRVVQIGTDEVYGSIAEGSWTEDSPLQPNSPYSAAKAAAEMMARAYFVTYGMNISTTRCSNNYGPFQFPEKVIPLFLTNLIDGLDVPLYGNGSNVRDWLHVQDHCRAIALVAARGDAGESYNIGGGRELSNRDLTSALLEAMGAGWDRVIMVEDRKGHDQRYSVDYGRIAAMGYAPQHSFEDGLAETVRWYREHEHWWRPLKSASALI
jgi:dTDP-glucose 4,6-dehydratase